MIYGSKIQHASFRTRQKYRGARNLFLCQKLPYLLRYYGRSNRPNVIFFLSSPSVGVPFSTWHICRISNHFFDIMVCCYNSRSGDAVSQWTLWIRQSRLEIIMEQHSREKNNTIDNILRICMLTHTRIVIHRYEYLQDLPFLNNWTKYFSHSKTFLEMDKLFI